MIITKMRLFLAAYLGNADGDARLAAEMAGYRWPEKAGPQLMARPIIQAMIARKAELAGLSGDAVLSRLADIEKEERKRTRDAERLRDELWRQQFRQEREEYERRRQEDARRRQEEQEERQRRQEEWERWERESDERLEQLFARLAAATAVLNEAYAVLGLTPPVTEAQVTVAYRQRARACHPDHGGSAEEMARLNNARDVVLRVIRRRA
jgi:hypothetical protein